MVNGSVAISLVMVRTASRWGRFQDTDEKRPLRVRVQAIWRPYSLLR